MPRVRPPHRSRPRFLPQGYEGNDVLNATGTVSEFDGGPGTDTCTYNGDQVTNGAPIWGGNFVFGCE